MTSLASFIQVINELKAEIQALKSEIQTLKNNYANQPAKAEKVHATAQPALSPELILTQELKVEIAQLLEVTPDQLPPHLTPQQAAKVLNVKPETLSIWRCVNRYRLPFIKTGKSPRYRVADIINFMTARLFEHTDKLAVGGANHA